jgi:hypothetical protein
MLALLAVFYMAAAAFKKPEYEGFVSIELHQLMVSAILAISIFAATQVACEIANGYAGADMYELGTQYLNEMSSHSLTATLFFEGMKMFAQFWGSMSFRWGVTVWGVAVPGFPSFIVIERLADFLLMLITPFTASLAVQQIILETIKGIAIPIVLPIGAVLRIFPPTRDAGSFLVASALGFGLVYPFTYVMHKDVVGQLLAKDRLTSNVLSFMQAFSHPDLSVFSAFNANILFNPDEILFKPLRVITYMLLHSLFLPALSMIITISFIKGMTKFIGQKLS